MRKLSVEKDCRKLVISYDHRIRNIKKFHADNFGNAVGTNFGNAVGTVKAVFISIRNT